MDIRLGTSGYSYKEWIGPFYPDGTPPGRFLEYYATQFDCVELNVTYYRLPSLKTLAGMARRTPAGFLFVIKANQALTHVRGEEAGRVLPSFKAALEPFREAGKLGGVLLQFPYSFKPGAESFAHVEWLARELEECGVVAEFRHRHWFDDSCLERLRSGGISICSVDEPALPNLPPPRGLVTGKIGYVRFHGRNAKAWWGKEGEERPAGTRYDYLYTHDELREWVPRIEKMTGQTRVLFAFFNNHPQGQAVANAREFRQILRVEPKAQP